MNLRILSPALDEIAEAALWLDSCRVGLGSEFWEAADELLERISLNPREFAKSEFATAEIDYRFAVIRRFSYVIHFKVADEEVQVLSVAHSARRPGYWLTRVKK